MYEVKIPSRYEFNILDKDNYGIYCKIDWVTVMFFDCTIYDVLCWLKLNDSVCEFALGQFEIVRGLSTNFVFQYNGVVLEVNDLHAYMDESMLDLKVFDLPMRKIRLDLSGSALDFLRSIGVDFNDYLFVDPNLPEQASYHFTRVDYAYDFINYCPDFMNEFKRYIDNNILDTGYVPCKGTKGGFQANIKTGKEFTIYIGSGGSKKLLRVYDKRLEKIDRQTGVYNKPNPYNNPSSWFRIEWQTRKDFANSLVFNRVPLVQVLKKLYDTYRFAERKRTSIGRSPVEFFQKLLNWDEIILPAIRQNLHLVKVVSLPERVINWSESVGLLNFCLYDELVPRKEISLRRARYVHNLYTVPGNERRLNMFINKLNECKINLRLKNKRIGFVEKYNRVWYIDLDNGIDADPRLLEVDK